MVIGRVLASAHHHVGEIIPRFRLLKRPFVTTKNRSKPKDESGRDPRLLLAAGATAVAAAGASLYTRRLREQKLSTLIEAKDSELLDTSASTTGEETTSRKSPPAKYNLQSLIETVTRAGLIGSTKSVKDELHVLRKWHVDHGYNGGIVVRDLSRPLFSLDSGRDTGADGSESGSGVDFAHRECYYLYYEVHSNGETRQQLFCRGTTLLADVFTCLQAWFVYDEELGCRLHYGFNQHANRIVEDVTPLLAPPPPADGPDAGRNYANATVEVCGHSLGGAVAMLVAVKLRKRGYHVSRVTSLAGPRFCCGVDEQKMLVKWLPKETIRIEDDLDIVSYLPPTGLPVGDKLWLTRGGRAYMLSQDSLYRIDSWADSFWLNLRLLETFLNQSKVHRVFSYVDRLEHLVEK